ncbi:hypothetical protein ANN_14495 [Periplaneta americana]|uniref:Reverse transcriptase zinc-binding domain-containing protein n=1 Tax=Periplaneta americana TaxID=6978 RepID=A0ABQ8SX39_PERAM|nr:hypothetical protein ANN_14495 [Periplaneta americana]
MWLVDEPREFNLPTLPQRCIINVSEKLPSKYGVHSEDYLPIDVFRSRRMSSSAYGKGGGGLSATVPGFPAFQNMPARIHSFRALPRALRHLGRAVGMDPVLFSHLGGLTSSTVRRLNICYKVQQREGWKKGWVYKLQRGLHRIRMGWVWEKGENNRRNVWRNVKMRLIDIERQEIELQCSEKSSLHLQSDLMLNWGRCDYINSCNKDSRAGLTWLRLGAWKGNKIVNEEGEPLCPLCKEKDSYKHILLLCVELEHVRRKYLPPSMLSQSRSSLACLDLIGNREWEQKTGLFLLKARKIRTTAVEVFDAN